MRSYLKLVRKTSHKSFLVKDNFAVRPDAPLLFLLGKFILSRSPVLLKKQLLIPLNEFLIIENYIWQVARHYKPS